MTSGWAGISLRAGCQPLRAASISVTVVAVCLTCLTIVVFRGGARAWILGALPLFWAGAWWLFLVGRGSRQLVLKSWSAGLTHLSKLGGPWVGFKLGLVLLAVRGLFWVFGWREMVSLGGQRVALSLFYTPALILSLAGILTVFGRSLRGAQSAAVFRYQFALLLRNLGAFIALAFVAPSWLISDYGIVLAGLPGPLTFLFMLALLFGAGGRERIRVRVGLSLPLALFIALQADPSILPNYPETGVEEDLRVQPWERNELLLLERGDPDALRLIGQRRSEALAVMRETLRSYTRGNWFGVGFFRGRVSPEIRWTATQEHTASALLASEWGLLGVFGLLVLLLFAAVPLDWVLPGRQEGLHISRAGAPVAVLLATPAIVILFPGPLDAIVLGALIGTVSVWLLLPPRASAPVEEGGSGSSWPELPPEWIIAALAVFTFSFTGLYMLMANYGWVLFTGKNIYLFGLDSVSDALESITLLTLTAFALGVAGAGMGSIKGRRGGTT